MEFNNQPIQLAERFAMKMKGIYQENQAELDRLGQESERLGQQQGQR